MNKYITFECDKRTFPNKKFLQDPLYLDTFPNSSQHSSTNITKPHPGGAILRETRKKKEKKEKKEDETRIYSSQSFLKDDIPL